MKLTGERRADKAYGAVTEPVHKDCLGGVKGFGRLGLYCAQCYRSVGINELREKPRGRDLLTA